MAHMKNRWTWIVLLLAALNIVLFGTFIGLRLAQPSDGARLQPGEPALQPDGVVVSVIPGTESDLQTGDRVTAINEQSLESWASSLKCWRPFCDSPPRPDWKVGDLVTYTVVRGGEPQQISVTLRSYPLADNLRQDWGSMLYALAMFLTGVFVLYKRPEDTTARALFLGGSSILGATSWSFGLQALDFVHPLTFWLHRLTTSGVYLLFWASVLHFALIFPNPHRLVLRHRWLVPAVYSLPFVILGVALVGTGLAASSTLDWLSRQGQDQNLTVTAYLVASLLALVTNYRSQLDSVSRQQIRVVVYAVSVNAVLAVLLWQLPQLLLGEQWVTSDIIGIVGLILPLSLLIAILRYRLWDIDLFINRTSVYGLLSILIVGLYIGLVGLLGMIFQQRGSLVFSLLATGVIALVFQPLRAWLQRVVNRMMYGERDTPYQVISRLGRQLENSAAPEDLLDTITRTVAEALKLPFAGIALLENGAFTLQSEYGMRPAEPFVLPLVYQREVVGQLAVAPRGPHDPLAEPDIRLLEEVAHQAGAVVHAVRLNLDLQRSRERLVIRLEEERRRLRRDLHDGLGPTLASYTFKLDSINDLIDADPVQARQLVGTLKQQTKDLVAMIRRLVYELRPPALDELGLVEALHVHLAQLDHAGGAPSIALIVPPDGLPPLSAAVEVAAYRIVMEGVTNVLHHANASDCRVQFRAEAGIKPALSIEISDDGFGLPEALRAGVGLVSMRERALELGGECVVENNPGGGTRVRVTLPISERKG